MTFRWEKGSKLVYTHSDAAAVIRRSTYFDKTTDQSAIDLALTFPMRQMVGLGVQRTRNKYQQLNERSRVDVASVKALDSHVVDKPTHFEGELSRNQQDHQCRPPWSLD